MHLQKTKNIPDTNAAILHSPSCQRRARKRRGAALCICKPIDIDARAVFPFTFAVVNVIYWVAYTISHIPTRSSDCSGGRLHILSPPAAPCLYVCVSAVGSETVIRAGSAGPEQAWVGAGQARVPFEQGERRAGFSQGDNFVLGQESGVKEVAVI
ncbi:unnamed protein product [Pleuronectes platessa]|uniref:Uncharacterized protein n=1 Tax=Pleuronectes platessa TaxID=8262 RepID=A0A9N7TR50_PLEPL|nr:unnamed protein product [Pleuronectes platessa]